MPIEITLPQLSDTMHEGKILRWIKKEGDVIKRGDAIAEVQTDKADLEIEAFHEGTLLQIQAKEGSTVQVGSVIATIGEEGVTTNAASNAGTNNESSSARGSTPQASSRAESHSFENSQSLGNVSSSATVSSSSAISSSSAMGSSSSEQNSRLKISPLARNVASAHGVDVKLLHGSGDGGRITKKDIETFLGRETTSSPPQLSTQLSTPQPQVAAPIQTPIQTSVRPQQAISHQTPLHSTANTEPLSQMRQTIARRMVESVSSIPHFYVTTPVLMDAAAKLKNSLKPLPQYQGITYNHLILKAVASALRAVPIVNAAYLDGKLAQPQDINIGIVTAVTGGLLIPVVKHADSLTLADIVSEARTLVQRARAGRPKADDLSGGTFSLSNMGLFAVESFTAIINPGQGGILALSAVLEEPVVVQGEIKPGLVMRATLSVDHRIIDGVIAGEFLTEFKRVLEDPVLLLA